MTKFFLWRWEKISCFFTLWRPKASSRGHCEHEQKLREIKRNWFSKDYMTEIERNQSDEYYVKSKGNNLTKITWNRIWGMLCIYLKLKEINLTKISWTQCETFRISLPLRFYVKLKIDNCDIDIERNEITWKLREFHITDITRNVLLSRNFSSCGA